jgi:excisionase family DNA binding protein
MESELMTIVEAARMLRLGRSTVYKLAESGAIPSVRVAGTDRVFFRRSDLQGSIRPRRSTESAPRQLVRDTTDCPECGAEKGNPCIGAYRPTKRANRKRVSNHVGRVQAAREQ